VRTVELRRRRPEDGETERLARVHASPGEPAVLEVLMPGLPGLEMMIADGIFDDDGRQLTLADGEAFVTALPSFYRGSRFWAEVVEQDDDG
jgi:hypothetical protein